MYSNFICRWRDKEKIFCENSAGDAAETFAVWLDEEMDWMRGYFEVSVRQEFAKYEEIIQVKKEAVYLEGDIDFVWEATVTDPRPYYPLKPTEPPYRCPLTMDLFA